MNCHPLALLVSCLKAAKKSSDIIVVWIKVYRSKVPSLWIATPPDLLMENFWWCMAAYSWIEVEEWILSLLLSELGGHWLTVVACRIWGKIKRPREAENNVLKYLRILYLLDWIQSSVIRIPVGEVISRVGAWVLANFLVPVSMRRVMDLKTRFTQ